MSPFMHLSAYVEALGSAHLAEYAGVHGFRLLAIEGVPGRYQLERVLDRYVVQGGLVELAAWLLGYIASRP